MVGEGARGLGNQREAVSALRQSNSSSVSAVRRSPVCPAGPLPSVRYRPNPNAWLSLAGSVPFLAVTTCVLTHRARIFRTSCLRSTLIAPPHSSRRTTHQPDATLLPRVPPPSITALKLVAYGDEDDSDDDDGTSTTTTTTTSVDGGSRARSSSPPRRKPEADVGDNNGTKNDRSGDGLGQGGGGGGSGATPMVVVSEEEGSAAAGGKKEEKGERPPPPQDGSAEEHAGGAGGGSSSSSSDSAAAVSNGAAESPGGQEGGQAAAAGEGDEKEAGGRGEPPSSPLSPGVPQGTALPGGSDSGEGGGTDRQHQEQDRVVIEGGTGPKAPPTEHLRGGANCAVGVWGPSPFGLFGEGLGCGSGRGGSGVKRGHVSDPFE